MVNLNVFDMVMDAVEEYNDYTRKKDVTKLSYGEKRGLFYNCLRRWLKIKGGRRPAIKVDDLVCTFSATGQLEYYGIPKAYRRGQYPWEQWDEFAGMGLQVKKVGEHMPKLYPTKVLNEMALIVNSIN